MSQGQGHKGQDRRSRSNVVARVKGRRSSHRVKVQVFGRVV